MRRSLLLSGGVDSSVALHLMMERGEEPDLFYIYIGAEEEGYADCPSEEDMEMVRWLAHHYGRPLEVINLHREYWDYVVQYMIDTVRVGNTPHPDMLCNRIIKFGFFNEYAGKAYDQIATGHYARKKIIGDKHYLATAVDPVKDQTDFLAQITYPQLQKAYFPIGELPKHEVRTLAIQEHLVTATRKDSQGICFLGKVDYNHFLRKYLGTQEGAIIELESGQEVGRHQGYWFHTIGQRKGLGLSGGPWFVIRKDTERNILYVSRGYDPDTQYGNVVEMPEVHFITEDPMASDELQVTFKVRHTPDFTPALLRREENGVYTLHSTALIQGIAPGQFCTLYDAQGNICYGSGVIARGLRE